MTETLTRLNGNHQQYTIGLPRLLILGRYNDVAREHIYEETGLLFKDCNNGNMEAQPHSSQQITQLFLTYNFKTRYYNNWDLKNTLVLKDDHHVGFDVDSICYDCCKENHIHTNGLKPGDRLSC
jgi:hypothetical protein